MFAKMNIFRDRGETADLGGFTPTTVAFIRLDSQMNIREICIYLQPINSLTVLLLRPEAT